MSIRITFKPGTTAQTFHLALMNAIDDETIKTWYFNSGTGFTHTAVSNSEHQWDKGAYLAYQSASDDATDIQLLYKVLSGSQLTKNTYGILNGRFVEMLMNHFKEVVARIELEDLRNS